MSATCALSLATAACEERSQAYYKHLFCLDNKRLKLFCPPVAKNFANGPRIVAILLANLELMYYNNADIVRAMKMG
jgi:hypothetical protein